MRSLRLSAVCTTLVVLASLMLLASVPAGAMQQTGSDETGYGARKPVFGGSGPTSGWGAIGTVVREALAGYGWDVQLCRSCAGAARAARLVAGAEVPARPRPGSDRPPPPNGPLDFGATGPHYLWWAYEGTHDYADDAEGPRRGLRLVANIQTPSYFLVAVEADSGITDLGQIEENGSPVRVRVHYQSRAFAPPVLDYYGLSEEAVEIFGGPAGNSTEAGETLDVMIGFGSLSGHYPDWLELDQELDLRFLELPEDLRTTLAQEFDLEKRAIPVGLFRGVDRPVPAVAHTGTALYGRDDMPDDFAYTLARAMDEQQHLLQWVNVGYSYNPHTVWRAFGVPLHPGAARYYRERGYMQ